MIPEIAEPIFKAFEQAGEQIYLVGGCVRDFLIHSINNDPAISEHVTDEPYTPKDLDFATSALPERTIEILKSNGMQAIAIGIEFGTIMTRCGGLFADITTFRSKESYVKGYRKPTVEFGKTIYEDLLRRDFTVNAMAMDRTGALVDPNNTGFMDLVTGLLYTPVDPEISFSDDPLRMLRAFRFDATLPLGLTTVLFDAIVHMKKSIHHISNERIVMEMNKLLVAHDPTRSLSMMADSGLLGEIFPELQTVVDFKQNQGKWHSKLVWPHTLEVVKNAPPRLAVRWAALFHDVAKPETYSESETGVHFYRHEEKGARIWRQIAGRMKMSASFTEEVEWLIHNHLRLPNLSDPRVGTAAIRRFMHEAAEKRYDLDNLFALSKADITSHHPEVVAEKIAKLDALAERCVQISNSVDLHAIALPTGLGTLVMDALGLTAGKELGAIMKQLKEGLIAGTYSDDTDFIKEAKEIRRQKEALKELTQISEELGLYDREFETASKAG